MDGRELTLSEIDFSNEISFTEELSKKQNLNNIKLPYVIKNRVIMSPGKWNEFDYSEQTISQAMSDTEWNERNRSLFWEHSDKDARSWVGDVKNLYLKEGHLMGDIYIVDKPLAVKLAYGAKFGVSPKVIGDANLNREVHNAIFANFSIVLNPAVKTTFLNSEIKMERSNMADENKKESVEKNAEKSFQIDYNLLAEKVAEKLLAKKETTSEQATNPSTNEMSEVEKLRVELAEATKKIAELSEAINASKQTDQTKNAEEKLSENKEANDVSHKDANTKDSNEMKDKLPGVEGNLVKEIAPQQSGDSQKVINQMREVIGPSTGQVELSCLPSKADMDMANWLGGLV